MRPISQLMIVCCGVSLFLVSCFKDPSPGYNTCTSPEPASDSTVLLQFAATNGITPHLDSTGLYYQIIDSGTGTYPTLNSKLNVKYIGTLMNGIIIDSTTDYANTGFLLGNLIQGWQFGLPKIKEGGRIKLLIPSVYAYGCTGSSDGIVPRNAPLYYDVTLVEIKF